jgi:LPS-assembly lipoprotein
MYAQSEQGASTALASVRVDRIAERSGQELRISLQDMFDPTGSQLQKTYALQVILLPTAYGAAIRTDGTASRNNYDLRATYILTDISTGKPIIDGTAHAIASFNVLRSDFATASSENDARRRAVSELAVTIQAQLAVYFERGGGTPPAPRGS